MPHAAAKQTDQVIADGEGAAKDFTGSVSNLQM